MKTFGGTASEQEFDQRVSEDGKFDRLAISMNYHINTEIWNCMTRKCRLRVYLHFPKIENAHVGRISVKQADQIVVDHQIMTRQHETSRTIG